MIEQLLSQMLQQVEHSIRKACQSISREELEDCMVFSTMVTSLGSASVKVLPTEVRARAKQSLRRIQEETIKAQSQVDTAEATDKTPEIAEGSCPGVATYQVLRQVLLGMDRAELEDFAAANAMYIANTAEEEVCDIQVPRFASPEEVQRLSAATKLVRDRMLVLAQKDRAGS